MLISYPNLTGVDLTGLNTYGPNSTVLDCAVQEVDPQGNLVWDWRASNHTDPAKESVVPAGAGTDTSPADGWTGSFEARPSAACVSCGRR